MRKQKKAEIATIANKVSAIEFRQKQVEYVENLLASSQDFSGIVSSLCYDLHPAESYKNFDRNSYL